MNNDEFEQQLTQQELRPLPASWRSEILKTAAAQPLPRSTHPSARSGTNWLRALLWPCPQAWAGLGVAWLVILSLRLSGSMDIPRAGGHHAVAEEVARYAENRQLLADLLTSRKSPPAATPAVPSPARRPRAQWRGDNYLA
jgi:hypothetical protein